MDKNKKEIAKRVGIEEVKHIYEETSKLIKKGKETKLSSTGMPMNNLKGGALYNAIKAAIGGGSKAIGGGGMERGDEILSNNVKSKTILKMYEKGKANIEKAIENKE